ncbi:MAG TPA: hypothetical protein VFM96_11365 [Gaiellaceae bacterium]|nr:hypothetical protein [Gaiellaceae bacterium]
MERVFRSRKQSAETLLAEFRGHLLEFPHDENTLNRWRRARIERQLARAGHNAVLQAHYNRKAA